MFNFIKNLIDNLQWWRVEYVLKTYQKNLSFYKNVWAVGKGYKFKKGKQTKEKCIICFVDKKLPETQLLAEEKIPRKIGGLFGCKCDIISLDGEIKFMNKHRQKMRPAKGGASCMWYKGTACTLGAKVWDKDTGQPYILSNCHCVFPHYLGAKKGDAILQQSPLDGGKYPQDKIGTAEKVIEIKPLPTRNLVDAAIVKIEDKDVSNEQIGLGKMGTKVVRAKVGDIVIKSSRTSEVNEGRVIATNVLARVRFDWKGSEGKNIKRIIYFQDQVFTSQNPIVFTRGGDSGSAVWIKKTKQPCGLIFAGSPRVGVMNNLDNVCKLLNITFTPLAKPVEGWVASRFIRYEDELRVWAKRLNIREEPGLSGKRITFLEKGQKVKIINDKNNGVLKNGHHWWRVLTKD